MHKFLDGRIKGGPSQYPEEAAALAFFRVPRINALPYPFGSNLDLRSLCFLVFRLRPVCLVPRKPFVVDIVLTLFITRTCCR